MKQIGSLFILRINWGGSILETPVSFRFGVPSVDIELICFRGCRNSFGRIQTWNRSIRRREATWRLLLVLTC